jgi:hypothetical protein
VRRTHSQGSRRSAYGNHAELAGHHRQALMGLPQGGVEAPLDFTTWLQENLDVLNDTVDVSLSAARREQAAGDFSVDLVSEDVAGDLVVIENRLERPRPPRQAADCRSRRSSRTRRRSPNGRRWRLRGYDQAVLSGDPPGLGLTEVSVANLLLSTKTATARAASVVSRPTGVLLVNPRTMNPTRDAVAQTSA